MTRRLLLTFVLIFATSAPFSGCESPNKARQYKTVQDSPTRNSAVAKQESDRASVFLQNMQYDEAEKALKKALSADIAFGRAHNNLGKVYYHQERLYLAAWEFQYAIQLMPNQPEPRNNLGLVFEAVGKLDDAVDAYSRALELEPDNPHLIGNLVRARVRRGDQDESVRTLLSDLIVRETRADWLTWARDTLALMGDVPDQEVEDSK